MKNRPFFRVLSAQNTKRLAFCFAMCLPFVLVKANVNYSNGAIKDSNINIARKVDKIGQDKLIVKGNVRDSNGEALIGASVVIKGTSIGTITDFDGNFSLQASKGNTLVVSFMGYLTEEMLITSKSTYNVVLKLDNKTLDEVVVIGYGTVKRRDLTGSVASVTGEKLAANPVPDIRQALQGYLPGVSTLSQDGRPGASMSIRVRGGGSITQSNEPLVIIDGIQGSLDGIPADNIESIDVLKDAASTAIYGARGANGVILVTTKSGKEGKVNIKINSYYQIKSASKELDVMDAYNHVLWNWAYGTAYGPSYGDAVAKYFGLGPKYGNHLNDYKNVAAHNYVDDVLKTASTWNHDITLSGGNDKSKFYATVNYIDDEGIRIKTNYSRWNANFKYSQKINKKLTADFDLRYTETKNEGAQYGVATSAFRYNPILEPMGDLSASAGFGNGDMNLEPGFDPISQINNYDNIRKRQAIRSNVGLTWNVLDGLTAKSDLFLGRTWQEYRDWNGPNYVEPYSKAKLENSNSYSLKWSSTLNYQVKGLGEDNNLSVLVGNELLVDKHNSNWMRGGGYPVDFTFNNAFGMIAMTDPTLGEDAFSSTIGIPNKTLSFFGRVNYSYKGRYLLAATFRADGSSKFASNHRWGYFPAAAAAWRISDEAFMENTREWLDNLKLRASYGTSGSDNINSSLWRETWKNELIIVDGKKVTTFIPNSLMGNSDLKWETTISRNLGLDFGFLNNRIHGSIDAYWNTTKDILMQVPVDAATGYSYQFQNAAQTSNKGIEIALGFDLIRKENFNLNLNLTYNYNHNNIDKLSQEAMADIDTPWGNSLKKPKKDYAIREDHPIGLIQGYKSAGFYTVNDFNYSNGVWTLKPGVLDTKALVNYPKEIMNQFKRPDGQSAFPGMAKFENINGDDVIDANDVTFIGETMAKHTGGFNLNGNYKALDFALGFTYQIGGAVYNANAMHSMTGGSHDRLGQNRLAFVKDCYRIYDLNSDGELVFVTTPDELSALNTNAKHASNMSEYGLVSSEFIEDASFLRLNTLTLGYTLPKNLTKKVGIQNARFYVTGGNLFCLTGYSGLDPDVNTIGTRGGFPVPNYDYCAYPKARTYTFGLNLTF